MTGSTERTPTDFIVQTQLIDPNSNQQPAEVDFRVRTDTGKPVLVDVAYQGIWLSLEERDQFVAFLGQNNGNVRTLIAHLSELAVNLGKPSVSGCSTQVELAPHIPGQPAPAPRSDRWPRSAPRTPPWSASFPAWRCSPGTRGEKPFLNLFWSAKLSRAGFPARRGPFPVIGDDVFLAGSADLAHVYAQPALSTLNVGTLYQDPSVPARLMADDLFSKHFAIVGTTGCGKSSALTCILREALKDRPHAHAGADMHGEYHRASFGPRPSDRPLGDLHLPFWLLNFRELRSVLTSPDDHHDAQVEILCDAIINSQETLYSNAARAGAAALDTSTATVDSPVPFRLSDLITYIDEQLGKLERPGPTLAYRRLKARIESPASDPRYVFICSATPTWKTIWWRSCPACSAFPTTGAPSR